MLVTLFSKQCISINILIQELDVIHRRTSKPENVRDKHDESTDKIVSDRFNL